MLFYRKKFLIAVLEAFGGSIENLKFQKYLFLILNKLNKKYYKFVPYKYGCFSFESYNDRRQLIHSKYLIENDKKWILNQDCHFLLEIHPEEKESIFFIKKEYGNLPKNKLLNKVYSDYPYYAVNSRIISEANLSNKVKKEIKNKKPHRTNRLLFTVGYEGRSIDEYLNLLIQNNIKVLCDVRRNPLSRKYGFTKKILKQTAKSLGIEYVHIPELGINSQLRRNLNTKKDYQKLFSIYKNKLRSSKKEALQQVMGILNKKRRIALTCFELQPSMCHRLCISSALKNKELQLDIQHL